MHKFPPRFTSSLIVLMSAPLVLAGCGTDFSDTTNEQGFTVAQQAMIDAGPYIPEGSDSALRACSLLKQTQGTIENSDTLSASGSADDFLNTIINAQQTSYLAAEQSPRYENLYITITGVDNAALDRNWEAVILLLEDAIQACQDMTVIDSESLAERGIEITPGVIPTVN